MRSSPQRPILMALSCPVLWAWAAPLGSAPKILVSGMIFVVLNNTLLSARQSMYHRLTENRGWKKQGFKKKQLFFLGGLVFLGGFFVANPDGKGHTNTKKILIQKINGILKINAITIIVYFEHLNVN